MSSPHEHTIETEPKREVIGSPEHRAKNRITIFGSSNNKELPSTLELALQVAGQLMRLSGFKLATGGINTGIMRVVADEAMRIAREKEREDLYPEAVAPKFTKKLKRFKNPTKGKVEYEEDREGERTRRLVDESNGIVVLNGGMGTVYERDYTLRHPERIEVGKPVVILDETGKHLNDICDDFLLPPNEEYHLSTEMLADVYVAHTAEDAQFVMEMYYRQKYGLEITDGELMRLHDLHIGHQVPGFTF